MKAFNRNIFRVLLTAGLLLAGTDVMWGSTYYGRGTIKVSPKDTGSGTVYISKTSSSFDDKLSSVSFDAEQDNNQSITISGKKAYLKAVPAPDYHFVEWQDDSETIGNTQDNQEITHTFDIKATSEDKSNPTTVTYNVYGIFAHDTYTVHFDANGGSGTMDDQTGILTNTDTKLNKLTYENNYTVTFDANGGLVNGKSSDSETKTRFTRWKYYTGSVTEGFIGYNDESNINLVVAHESTITLKATWDSDVAFTFPTATRGDRTFLGWYDSNSGGAKKGDASESVRMKTATLYAHWGDPFYAKVSLSETEGASASATVDATEKNSDTKNTDLTFSIEAKAPATGYHFTGWSGTNVTFADNSQLKTTATVKSSSTAGVSAETVAEIKANYAPNVYWASLTATYGEHGTASVTATPKSTTTPGGDVVFEITAVPQTGYHLDEWTREGSVGTFGSSTSATTTFTVPAATSYDVENATSYTVHATFAKDMFNAKLTTSVSSLSPASSSTAKVSKDNTAWSESETVSAATSNQDVTFYVKATPAAGYEFLGWSLADNSTDYVAGLGAEGTYTIKSAVNQGDTNAIILYAVFRAVYTIQINANCATSSTDMIVFNVSHKTESVNYRVSVPVGGTITLTDVPAGAYTVTPESAWSWDYTVSDAQTTDFNAENLSVHNFTVTPENSEKKHVEQSVEIVDF